MRVCIGRRRRGESVVYMKNKKASSANARQNSLSRKEFLTRRWFKIGDTYSICKKMGPVIHEGWLLKSPPEKKLSKARWKQRYFVLKECTNLPGQYVLEYYNDQKMSGKPRGCIYLDQCERVDANVPCESRNDYVYMFALHTSIRKYFLLSKSESDMNRWVDYLCHACGLKRESSESEMDDIANFSPSSFSQSNNRSANRYGEDNQTFVGTEISPRLYVENTNLPVGAPRMPPPPVPLPETPNSEPTVRSISRGAGKENLPKPPNMPLSRRPNDTLSNHSRQSSLPSIPRNAKAPTYLHLTNFKSNSSDAKNRSSSTSEMAANVEAKAHESVTYSHVRTSLDTYDQPRDFKNTWKPSVSDQINIDTQAPPPPSRDKTKTKPSIKPRKAPPSSHNKNTNVNTPDAYEIPSRNSRDSMHNNGNSPKLSRIMQQKSILTPTSSCSSPFSYHSSNQHLNNQDFRKQGSLKHSAAKMPMGSGISHMAPPTFPMTPSSVTTISEASDSCYQYPTSNLRKQREIASHDVYDSPASSDRFARNITHSDKIHYEEFMKPTDHGSAIRGRNNRHVLAQSPTSTHKSDADLRLESNLLVPTRIRNYSSSSEESDTSVKMSASSDDDVEKSVKSEASIGKPRLSEHSIRASEKLYESFVDKPNRIKSPAQEISHNEAMREPQYAEIETSSLPNDDTYQIPCDNQPKPRRVSGRNGKHHRVSPKFSPDAVEYPNGTHRRVSLPTSQSADTFASATKQQNEADLSYFNIVCGIPPQSPRYASKSPKTSPSLSASNWKVPKKGSPTPNPESVFNFSQTLPNTKRKMQIFKASRSQIEKEIGKQDGGGDSNGSSVEYHLIDIEKTKRWHAFKTAEQAGTR